MSAPINCCRKPNTASPALTTFYSGGADYDAVTTSATFTSGSANSMQQSINIIEDLDFEPTEEFSISLSTSSPDCTIPTPLIPVTILDDGEIRCSLLVCRSCVCVTCAYIHCTKDSNWLPIQC